MEKLKYYLASYYYVNEIGLVGSRLISSKDHLTPTHIDFLKNRYFKNSTLDKIDPISEDQVLELENNLQMVLLIRRDSANELYTHRRTLAEEKRYIRNRRILEEGKTAQKEEFNQFVKALVSNDNQTLIELYLKAVNRNR